MKEILWHALISLANVPSQQPTLTGLMALVQDQQLRLALSHYTYSGPYGELLDADQERLSTHSWQCFDLEQLMSKPKVVPPVLEYIFHVLQKRFDGRPTLLILDEAWVFLDHPLFVNKIREWLKTLRKLNVSVIFATQSVTDILESAITSTLLESCSARIFLPNNRAMENTIEQAYLQLGLNERQIQIITNATPKSQYYYQSSLGCCLFELGLGKATLAFCSMSGPEQKHYLRQLRKTLTYEAFLQEYLSAENLGSASTLFRLWHEHFQTRNQ